MHKHASYSYCACSWHQQTNPSRKKIFYAIFYFGILLQKNWLRLWQQFKLNMESCEPVDEEELPTFSLGMEFLTPPKKWKEKENKEQAWLVSSHFATLSESKLENININVIKQLVHMSAVHSSRYEALGKFGEHSRSSLKQLLCIFVLSKTSCVLHILMNIC